MTSGARTSGVMNSFEDLMCGSSGVMTLEE